MAFTAQDVKTLRERTNCGMMDCKKALADADGDMERAIEILREKGLAKQAKKAGRIAAEGLVQAYVDEANNCGVVIEVNAETDFVAKNADFVKFVDDCAKTVAEKAPADVAALSECIISGGDQTVAATLT
ncbi:MAG: translation elongation factor Ts, partial [Ruminococcaceae bacterium]|nr:translation elongation factor Ts [Oscillospiraceae bacterium]